MTRAVCWGPALLTAAAVPAVAQLTTPAPPDTTVGPAAGSWYPDRRASHRHQPTPEQLERIRQLESIGYLGGVEAAPTVSDVTVHDSARARPGLNFYTSGHGPEAFLIDMEGRELHRWRVDFADAFPDHSGRSHDRHGAEHWRRAKLLPDGGVLAIFEGIGILRCDRDSNLLWAVDNRAHHDLELRDDGTFWLLTREARMIDDIFDGAPVLEDFLVLMDLDGREHRRVSIVEALDNSKFKARWRANLPQDGDILHTNSVRELDGRYARGLRAFADGNLLISMRSLHMLAVIDPDRERAVWVQEGTYRAQHDAHLLPNGNLLVFDNLGMPRSSSVQELDPRGAQLEWVYRGTPEARFFTRNCGTAYRLDNGNTLMIESNAGRALEVTPQKDLVWEFYNPHRAGDDDEFIANLFDLVRIPAEERPEWLE